MVEAQLPIHKQKKIRSDDFLSKPTNEALNGQQDEIARTVATYKDNSGRFKIQKKEFVQYSHIYMHRLQRMRPFLQQQAENQWSKDKLKFVDKILHLKPGHRCIVTGTLYKDMPLKPNVLKEYAKDRAILPVPVKKSFINHLLGAISISLLILLSSFCFRFCYMIIDTDGDELVLEDETGRIKLQGLTVGEWVTGIPIALKGVIGHGGSFDVEDACVAGFPPQPDLPLQFTSQSAFVALVSGLNVGLSGSDELSLGLLADYLGGMLGSHDELTFSSTLVRIILAGNNVCSIKVASEAGALLKYQTKRQIDEEHEKMSRPIAELDHFLTMLGPSVPVDIMPGEQDPANFSLPQQPLNPCLLPLSSRFGTCKQVSNPYEAEIGGRIFLGTSGQPVSNAMRYMESDSPLDLMESTLTWRHIAPTVPDTLAAYPFKDDDPFILDQCPHVYFIGNQPQFESKMVTGPDEQSVRLIAVPEFSTSHTIVLVDLRDLSAFPVHIHVDSNLFA